MQWPTKVPGLAYGGDYNPEQWPQQVRIEDIQLMTQAQVNLVSVGIFSWAMIEPAEGEYDWAWLDETMDRLHAAGIGAALATATASPPPWLIAKHPEILPQTADGATLWPGARQHYSPSNPIFRKYALGITRAVAERYADHPALALWHVDNELGCHNAHDYSDDAAAGFRLWLQRRYGTVEQLNSAWGTAFWSQRYSSFDQVLPPRKAPMFVNPTHQLDFHRFSSDVLLEYFTEMKEILREATPQIPVTTNFMCTTRSKSMDYFSWAPHMDVIATDHYTIADDDERHIELAFSADLTRGVAVGKPWMLMEHSTSAVNWQQRNRTKSPAEMLRDSLGHVARGADAVMFFQWRQSQAGAEKFHSAMVPHAGPDGDVFSTTVALGSKLKQLSAVQGSTVTADVALLFDYEAWWAAELDSHPNNDLSYPAEVMRWYRAFWKAGVTVDVVHPSADLGGYRAVVVPALYLVSDENAKNVASAAQTGASVLVSYFSGIADEHDHIRLGGYPGAFRELLGIRSEEFWTLQEGEQHRLTSGSHADFWSENLHVEATGDSAAEVVDSWAEGPLQGKPAVTRHATGSGAAWYVSTRLEAEATQQLVEKVLTEAGISSLRSSLLAQTPEHLHADVEMVRRQSAETSYLFVLNHNDEPVTVTADGDDLLSGEPAETGLTVPAGGVAVIAT